MHIYAHAHVHAYGIMAPRAATHSALLELYHYHHYHTTTLLLPLATTTTTTRTATTTSTTTFEVLGEADGVVARVGAAPGLNVLAHELAHLFVG